MRYGIITQGFYKRNGSNEGFIHENDKVAKGFLYINGIIMKGFDDKRFG